MTQVLLNNTPQVLQKLSKIAERSRGQLEGFLFNKYDT